MTVAVLTVDTFRTAVAAAVRAPSLHNTQPWRFRLRERGIEVLADRSRALVASDPTCWAMRVACGAATFNLRLALAVAGCPVEVTWRPNPADPDLMARLVPSELRPASPAERLLYAAISRRHSNRAPFWSEPVPPTIRSRLVEAARAENAWLDLVAGVAAVGAVAEIAKAANRVLERDPRYREELIAWTRSAESARDGVPAAAGGPSPEPQDLLPQRPYGDRARAPGRDFEPDPLVGVLGTAGDLPADQLTAGQALQRVLLTATDAGLAVSMLSQPIEVPAAREQLRLALGRFGIPQMVLRIGYGEPGWSTPRRDLDDVIETTEP